MEAFSALNRPSAAVVPAEPQVLTDWHVDDVLSEGDRGGAHANFDPKEGVISIPRDGLYSVVVEVIPSDGTANVSNAVSRRKEVTYAVRIEDPENNNRKDEADEDPGITAEYRDVGPKSFGELCHLKQGTRLSIQWLAPGTNKKMKRRESVRLKIELVQRKRKRARSPELSKKELKKKLKQQKKNRNNKRRKVVELESDTGAVVVPGASESDTGGDSSEEWSFSSDESGPDDDDATTKTGKQLASKLKIKY